MSEAIAVIRQNASVLPFLRDPVQFFRSASRYDASLTEFTLGPRRFYLVYDPAIIRDVLTTQAALFEKFPAGNPKQKLFGGGLLTSEAPAHKEQRRMLLPTFHRDRLKLYAQQMIACTVRLGSSWLAGAHVDIAHEMNRLTLEIIGGTLLGVSDGRSMETIGGHLHTMLSLVNRFVVPWGDWLMKLPLPSTVRYHAAARELDRIVLALIRSERAATASETLVRLLIDTTHADCTPLTEEEIRDEIVTMVVAGHETVAVGLTWTLFELACRPNLQDELAASTFEILGDRCPEADDYPHLEALQHAFAEALRLHPPIWVLGRRNLDDYSFRNFEAPRGSIFLVCIADLHRRASFFPDPDSFLPERWANPEIPPYAYIPFGGGVRRCIGERFAWMEAVFVLAGLLRQWRFVAVDTKPPRAVAKLTLHPRDPVWLRIERRRAAATTNDGAAKPATAMS